MVKKLEISEPGLVSANFFNLIHPFNIDEFKSILREPPKISQEKKIELYIKNGIYHPMKWEVALYPTNFS